MKNIVFFFAFIVLHVACQRSNNNTTISPEMIIKLPEKPATSIEIGKILNKIKVISLETNEDCLIGEIEKLRVVNNRIYIHDYHNKSLLVFNKKRKFLFKIYSVGKGPGEYLYLRDFFINEGDKKIIILGGHYKMMEYTMEGEFIKEHRMKIAPFKFGMLDDGTTYFWTGSQYFKENNFSVIKTDNNYKLKEYYFPYEGKRLLTSSNMFTRYENILYFRPFPYTNNNIIYALTHNGILPKYKIDFGTRNWPENSDYNQRSILINNGLCYFVNDFFETKCFITFRFAIKSKIHRALYCKKTGNAIWWRVRYDRSLPEYLVSKIMCVEHDNYYAAIEPSWLKESKLNYLKYDLTQKHSSIIFEPENVYHLIDSIHKTDNPIIFKFSIKEF